MSGFSRRHITISRRWSLRSDLRRRLDVCTIISRNPEQTSTSDLISRLPIFDPEVLRYSVGDVDDKRQRSLAVFLLTPAFASRLEEQPDFIAKALEHILPSRFLKGPLAEIRCNTLVAIVDKIPSKLPGSDVYIGAEGLSFYFNSKTRIKEFLNSTSDIARGADDPRDIRQRDSILFEDFWAGPGLGRATEVTLAQTMFVNGSRSTMCMGSWTRHRANGNWTARKLSRPSNCHVDLPSLQGWERSDMLGSSNFKIPLQPITLARRIADGYGNIVRRLVKLDDADAPAMPASEELEQAVTRYLDSCPTDTPASQPVQIWAAVAPAEKIIGESSTGHFLVGSKNKVQLWTKMLPKAKSNRQDMKLIRRLISDGAILRRVLSGGGGWGSKRGLLSLDPDISYGPNLIHSWLSGQRIQRKKIDEKGGLGEAARVGDVIQFFAIPSTRSREGVSGPQQLPPDAAASSANGVIPTSSRPPPQLAFVFGTIPSTVDDLQVAHDSHEAVDQTANITVIPDLFGALSEGGLSHVWCSEGGLQFDKTIGCATFKLTDSIKATRIDVPHSRVIRKFTESPPDVSSRHAR